MRSERSPTGVARWLLGVLLLSACLSSQAGNQKEEALADSVRVALSRAISDPRPPQLGFTNDADRDAWRQWSAVMSVRLQSRMPDAMVRSEFLQTVWYESRRAGLEPGLVLGLIQVESGFRKYAISSAGARGYMQVMPFWTRVIGDGQPAKLFHMQTNLRYGCSILRMYLDLERGDLFLALGRYNGSRGKSEYPNAVRAALRRWQH
ncbi:MAG: lytic transglycosylase domain-containing protein [Oxalobacteraceae bacterium]|nr:lytic transglycosylase domain-containing protein [Oxalobacteraceae bacterium]